MTAGFTGHEHDDDLGFINMRGRIQDPHIGNFLSADPYVSRPGFSQSFNRYSYVVNSPLSYTDPSGFVQISCTQQETPQQCDGRQQRQNEFESWVARAEYYHETGLHSRTVDYSREFQSPREQWNDDQWYTQTARQNWAAAGGSQAAWDSARTPRWLKAVAGGLLGALAELGLGALIGGPAGVAVVLAVQLASTLAVTVDPSSPVARVFGAIRALPITLVGIAVAVAQGAEFIGFGNGGLEFQRDDRGAARAYGNVHVYTSNVTADKVQRGYYTDIPGVTVGRHEEAHTLQYGMFGLGFNS